MSAYAARIREALPLVRERIARAEARAGRPSGSVRVVAVTKGHPFGAVEAAVEAGLADLGENRVEEMEEKARLWQERAASGRAVAEGPGSAGFHAVRWHMIGRLQRRRAPRVFGVAWLVHSVDSVELAERLDREAPEGAAPLGVLVQVNTSGEASKTGFDRGNAVEGIGRVLALRALRVEGLMTMAPLTEDEAVLRATFRGLRETHEEARRTHPGYRGTELSMGMSNDYEIAVEEGSTMVRLGTVLLGERPG